MNLDQLKPFVKAIALATVVIALSTPPLGAQPARLKAAGLRSDAPIYAKHGPFWVGCREVVISMDGGRTVPATLWYPALNPKGAKEAGTMTEKGYPNLPGGILTIRLHGIADAPPDPSAGPYPLVVYLKGKPDMQAYHSYHLAHIASHGFVVLGADFDWNQVYRPSPAMHFIEFAVRLNGAGGPFTGLIDVNRVAVEGFSWGGPGALEIGGAHFHTESQQDHRVKAIIAIAPTLSPDQWNFSTFKLPVLVMICSKDTTSRLEASKTVYDSIPAAAKSYAILSGGNHLSFFNPDIPWANFGSMDKNRTGDLFNHFATALLLDVLKGDKKAHNALLPEAVKFKDVQYTATLK